MATVDAQLWPLLRGPPDQKWHSGSYEHLPSITDFYAAEPLDVFPSEGRCKLMYQVLGNESQAGGNKPWMHCRLCHGEWGNCGRWRSHLAYRWSAIRCLWPTGNWTRA